MNTEPKKPFSLLKLVGWMVGIFVVCFIGFVGVLFVLDTRDFLTPTLKLAARSPLIILTRVDTNGPTQNLVITQIWKQPKDISPKVVVGAKLPFKWPSGALPEGVVIFYERSFPPIYADRFIVQREFFVQKGRVDIDQKG